MSREDLQGLAESKLATAILGNEICVWSQEDWDTDWFNTSCGQSFILNEGPPSENKMRFCPFCGSAIREQLFANIEAD